MRSVRVPAILAVLLAAACGGGPAVIGPPPADPHTDPSAGPGAGNPDAPCAVAADALAEDVTTPTAVVGSGTPASCTGAAFVSAVESTPGVITFDCGPEPVVVTVPRTARVFNRVAGRDVQRV